MNKMYGFDGEVRAKYTAQMCELFTEVYNRLPLAHCISSKILVSGLCSSTAGFVLFMLHVVIVSCGQVMHGGLFSNDDVTLDDIRKVDRNRQPPDSGSCTSSLDWNLH